MILEAFTKSSSNVQCIMPRSKALLGSKNGCIYDVLTDHVVTRHLLCRWHRDLCKSSCFWHKLLERLSPALHSTVINWCCLRHHGFNLFYTATVSAWYPPPVIINWSYDVIKRGENSCHM